MLNVNYAGLKETDLVAQATKDINVYENGGQYSSIQLSDLQVIEKQLQRAEFVGIAGGAETRKRAQEILTRDAGIKFAEKSSMLQERQGITNTKRNAEVLECKANRAFRNVGTRY